ncbi:MAG: hypothetical protein JXA87_15205 [Thermoleophilia bacterium]|nr:hypothetical protein [Thermoleophilia bacterium]
MKHKDASGKGPYAKYVHELDWPAEEWNTSTDSGRPGGPAPFLPPSLFINGKQWPVLNKHIEVFIIGEPCGTFPAEVDPAKPAGPPDYLFADGDDESIELDLSITAHSHRYQEIYLFIGTDPKDPRDLGGELELWVGAGAYAEKLTITKSSVVVLPPGLVAHPMVFRRVDRPIVKVVIYDSPVLDLFPAGVLPPDFQATL